MEQVTVKIFDNAISARLLKARLESEEIDCFIQDEHMVTMNPLFNVALGGIKLKVWEKDVEKALEVINILENQPLTNDQNEDIQCPKCNSTQIYTDFKSMKGATGVLSAIISFMLLVFPIYFKRVKKCKICGTEF